MSETTTASASRLPKSFTKKQIDVTFTITSGGQAPGGTVDRQKLSGYRCQVEVTNAGVSQGASCNLRIYGLSLPLMNRMSLMPAQIEGIQFDMARTTLNTILIEAGDDERGMTTIFNGIIWTAFADFSSVPEPAFNITCFDIISATTSVIAPHSFPAGTSVAGMISQIASDAGYAFVNYGVNIRATGPVYVHGTLEDQVRQLQKAYKFIYSIPTKSLDGANATQLVIWSNNLKDVGFDLVPTVNARTGLIGYPSYNGSGVTITSYFDQRLQYMTAFKIESEFLPAAWVNNQAGQIAPMPVNGTWVAKMVTHELDSEIPEGRWFTRVEAVRWDVFPYSN